MKGVRCPFVTATLEWKAMARSGIRAYYSLAHLFRSKRLSRAIKVRLYTSIVRPVFTYGAEAWTITALRDDKIAVAKNNVLRRCAGPAYNEQRDEWRFRSNAEIKELAEIPPILNVTRRLRLQYAGHVLRGAVPPATRTRATLDAPPVTRRPVGGVRRRFYDQVDKEAKSLDIQDWRAAALDRPTWQEAQKRLLAQPDPREDRREAAKRRRQERQQQQDQQQHQDQDELGDP